MKLTQQTVETALYEGRSHMSKSGRKRWSQHVLWDDGLPGFGLRITSTNRKSFIVSYRAGNRKRTKTIGTADKLRLSEARERAAELLESVAEESPRAAAKRPRMEGVETVAQLADAYLEGHLKGTAPSWFADQRLMRMHIKPHLGRSPIAEVTPMDLANLHGRIARRFPADARRLKPLLGGMFDWAAEHGLWTRSPGQKGPSRTRPAHRAGTRSESVSTEARSETEAAPTALPPAEELMESLRQSEEQRQALAERLEEVSSSGLEMLAKLNEQAAAQNELETELATSRRELEKARLEAKNRPNPEKAKKQVANLQLSVEQLMDSLNEAESDRTEMADKLAVVEARAGEQAKKVAALIRSRNELESQILEEERVAAIRKVQRIEGGSRRQLAVWLAMGAIGGILLTLAVERAIGPPTETVPYVTAEPVAAANPAAQQQATGVGVIGGEPSASADPESAAGANAAGPAGAAGEPDFAAAEAAVLSWAAAWSEQRVDDYLAAYAEQFVPPDGLGRQEWASQRRNRVLRPASIRVTLRDLRQTVAGSHRVRLSFQQSYETDTFADQVSKTLEMVWESGGWKIAAEQAG